MKPETEFNEAKQKKFLVFLPVLVLPFIMLIFWTLGGGKDPAAPASDREKSKVNMALPDASFERDKPQDKMSFYAQAKSDSLKRLEQNRLDPYLNQHPPAPNDINYNAYSSGGLNRAVYGGGAYNDPNEAKIYSKLNELNTVLNQPSAPSGTNFTTEQPKTSGVNSADIDRLQSMMNAMQDGGAKTDPEMQQINTMLERILDIQHPERAQDKLNQARDSKRGQVYAVTTQSDDNPVTFISSPSKTKKGGISFYGLEESGSNQDYNSIAAVVHDNQTVVSGSIVKLRLVNDIMIRGQKIPKDNFIFGQTSISGERLRIDISNIRYNNSIFPVKLSVYDLDGMDGIHIPGAISRDIAKESGTDVMDGIGLNSFDPSFATQAASTGIELSKNLIKKKVKLVKVTLKAGYKLLLKDDNQKESN